MKKLLLSILGGAVALGAYAQQNSTDALPFVQKANEQYRVPVKQDFSLVSAGPSDAVRFKSNSANKTTGAGGKRWYNHFSLVEQFFATTLANNTFVQSIWFDSTVKQRFNTGLGTINFSAVSQVIDPFDASMFNDPSFASDIRIQSFDAYTVDSVSIRGAYVRMPGQPANQVDTMVLSVIPMDNIAWFLTKSNYPSISNYITGDTLYGYSPVNADSATRSALPGTNVVNNVPRYWKEPLTAADGDTPNTTNNTVTVRTYVFTVPRGGLSVGAGDRFAVTAAFKSGGTWNANVDSVTALHRFMPIAGAVAPSTAMPYYANSPTSSRSMAGLMFSTGGRFVPSVHIEVFNTTAYAQEFFNIGAHVTCATCETVGINDVNTSVISASKAYPNPAQGQLFVPFALNATTNATVTLTNTVGQIVKTQSFNNVNEGRAEFSTSDLANGVYFYTVEAQGQRQTGRVVVAN